MAKDTTKKQEFKLTLLDRILLKFIFPDTGNFDKIIIRKSIKKMIDLSIDEIEKYGIVDDGKGPSWNKDGIEARFTYRFSDLQRTEIINSLRKLNDESKLYEDHEGLYELFINGKKDNEESDEGESEEGK